MDSSSLQLTQPPKMRTQMLIRKPVTEVFNAFIDPDITSKFWFSKGSAPLWQDTTVTWEWEMFGVSAEVRVKLIEQDQRIEIEWGDKEDSFTQAAWEFKPHGEMATLVTITEHGFTGTGDEVVNKALDSMNGFSYVLAGAKSWLEHGIDLKLVKDHAPTS